MIFKQLEPNSISVTPFVAHKFWDINSSDTSSGVVSYAGTYYSGNPRSLQVSNLTSTTDGFPTAMIHQSIMSMFVGGFADAPLENIGQSNHLQERVLYENVNVISVPQKLFGETIHKTRLEFDIDLPNGVYLLNNSYFETSASISPIFDPYTITQTGVWYVGQGNIANILNKQLYITNTTGQPTELYQLISSGSIKGGNYLLSINIANMTSNNIDQLSVRIYQPSVQNTVFVLPITGLNQDLEASIQLDSSTDALIIIRYPNIIQNIIAFNKVSINELETRLIKDDGNGNLVDILYSQSSAAVKNEITPNIVGEWNFRNGYRLKNTNVTGIETRDDSRYKNHGMLNNVTFTDGTYSTKATFDYIGSKTIETITVLMQDEYGNVLEFPVNIQMKLPDNYIRSKHDPLTNQYNFKRQDDFCISGMVELKSESPVTQSIVLPSISIDGKSSIGISYRATTGKFLSWMYNNYVSPIDISIITTNGLTQMYNKPSAANWTLNIYDDISYINIFAINAFSYITNLNLINATGLKTVITSKITNPNAIIILPQSNSIDRLTNSNNNIYITFDNNNFSNILPLNIQLQTNNYNYLQINNILNYFNTYYTNPLNNGSRINLSGNPGCYDSTGLILSSSLSSSGWTVIP